MPFRNRADAGRQLASALVSRNYRLPVVLALPRGGVPVAAEVAGALNAGLDLVLVRKLGMPIQPELAMGAIVEGDPPIVVRNEDVIRIAGIDETEFGSVCDLELAEIDRRRRLYLGGRQHAETGGRTAIIIDDGIATGATTRAALRAVRLRGPAQLVLAVPVAATRTLAELGGEADEIVCLEDHEPFGAIGLYYEDFAQVSDEEVIRIMAKFPVSERAAI